MQRYFSVVSDEFRTYPKETITIPARSTSHSAGYDFYAPVDITILPNSLVRVMTDVKAHMPEDEVLLLFPRSSVGKLGIMLANQVGVIDSDFADNPKNDGNIAAMFYNYGSEVVKFAKGDKIMQGVFVKYGVTDDDHAVTERSGGIGSTGR